MKLYIGLFFVLFFAVIYSLFIGVKPVKIEKACPSWFTKTVENSSYQSIYAKLFLSCSLKGKSLNPFYKSGTGHLLTISGLHVASLVFTIYFFLNILLQMFFKRHIPLFYVSLPISLIVTLLYIIFIGFEVPRLRAFIMISFFAISFIVPIFKNRLFLIFSSMILILFLFPNSIYSLSFYFSYLAVFAIYLSRGVKKYKFLYVPSIIFVFLIPVNLYIAGKINFLHIFANMLFVPLFSLFYYPFLLFFFLVNIVFDSVILMDIISYPFYFCLDMFSRLSTRTSIFIRHISIKELFLLYLVLFSVFLFFETYNPYFIIFGAIFMFFVFILNTVWYGVL